MTEVLKKSDFFGPDGFPVSVARRQPQPPFPRHRHQFSELVLVTGGTGLHAVRDEEYPVAAGDVFTIADSSPHEYRDMNELALINIMYDPRELEMSTCDVRALPGYHAVLKLEPRYRRKHKFESRLTLEMEDLARVTALVDRLDAELSARAPGFRLMATSLFMQIVGFLSRCYGQARTTSSRALLRIGEAISYLEEHYSEDVDLDRLAGIARMSRRNFSRTFREAMDKSAIDYLLHLRIARASELLRSHDQTITETAFGVGFTDSSYFSRQFRRITGKSPREWRAS
jgi:AraC family L-rhamnose operon transcriptional activator RhaR/AraC family L-rhamnose operon regulatory protein RhaS